MKPRCLRHAAFCLLAISCAARALTAAEPGGDGTGSPGTILSLSCAENAVVTMSASPATLDLRNVPSVRGETTVSWSVKLPAICGQYKQLSLSGTPVAFTGSKTYTQITADTTFALTLVLPGGTATLGQTNVKVTLPHDLAIRGGTPFTQRAQFLQALREGNHAITLDDDVDMDLSGHTNVPIRANTVVSGGRAPDKLGARLSTTQGGPYPTTLLVIDGDNVTLKGFRVQGPHAGFSSGGDTLERGVYIDSHTGIDIGNMEFSGWGGKAIDIDDNANRLSRYDTNGVTVHDSFFHHNQHEGGDGYGVSLGYGAHARIVQNVFDFDRHAISADGRPGTGYTATRNLVLKGMGLHRCYLNDCVHTHAFDMHARDHCGFWHGVSEVFEWLPGVEEATVYNCGLAGEFMDIGENAFQYASDNAFKLRGTPSHSAFVHRNVFAHDTLDAAVVQNETGISYGGGAEANRVGYDSFGRYGACDFDGDGKDDLFLATGASWWFMSSARMHWVFLRSATETIDQLALGRFTGPGKCDVFAVHGASWDVSRGGTQAWESLGLFGVPMSELRFGDFDGDGITDVFRRDPQGQWSIVSPRHFGWQAINSSSQPLSALRFGDFDHDGRTDVLGLDGGHWAMSSGGRTAWTPLNMHIGDSPSGTLVADIDGNGVADVLRYVWLDALTGRWEISWDGRGGWQTLITLTWPSNTALENPAASVRGFVGKFSNGKTDELLSVDSSRMGQIYSRGLGKLVPYSLYAY
jgi:hypothetical protein